MTGGLPETPGGDTVEVDNAPRPTKQKGWNGEAVVEFRSSRVGKKPYTVYVHPEGWLYCNCPGWKFKKAAALQLKQCSHVTRTMGKALVRLTGKTRSVEGADGRVEVPLWEVVPGPPLEPQEAANPESDLSAKMRRGTAAAQKRRGERRREERARAAAVERERKEAARLLPAILFLRDLFGPGAPGLSYRTRTLMAWDELNRREQQTLADRFLAVLPQALPSFDLGRIVDRDERPEAAARVVSLKPRRGIIFDDD